MITFFIPIRTYSELNKSSHEHWRHRQRRMKEHKDAGYMFAKRNINATASATYSVTLTRVAPRKLDSDNLPSSCKGIRDGIAAALGIDDGSERITWSYAQRPARDWEDRYGVEVQFEERESDEHDNGNA